MFGEKGKEKLDEMFNDEPSQASSSISPRDIWDLYNEYLERVSKRLGIDVAQVIRFQSSKEMDLMSCSKCPLCTKTE